MLKNKARYGKICSEKEKVRKTKEVFVNDIDISAQKSKIIL